MPQRPRLSRLPTYGSLLGLLVFATPARAIELLDGRIQVHGYVQNELRTISEDFRVGGFYLSSWTNILAVEIEADIAPDGFGPFDLVSGFSRLELRFNCAWTKACGIARSVDSWGDRAKRVPREFADGRRSGVTGVLQNPDEGRTRLHNDGNYLLPFTQVPPLDTITELGGVGVPTTFGPVLDSLFAIRKFGDNGILPQGPWNTGPEIEPIGSLRSVRNVTIPNLPLRPVLTQAGSLDPALGGAQGLYVPSQNLRREMDRFGPFDQNYTQNELEWNHGAGQDEHELKELYLDLEMLEGRLRLRLGKQFIVWGKTELFRTTDQFNPVDIGLVSLGSLEETRIGLWSIDAIYSFYDVGPLEDVRLELAANLDQFEPIDLGRCGEPYAVFLVCGKSVGLFAHGILGAGLAGEIRPPDPWDDVKGLEFGARLEFRWDRFSFAITDFYGYSDSPTAKTLNAYERKVDPWTGRPLDVNGNVLDPADPNVRQRAIDQGASNRQFFDVFCSATIGVAGNALPGVTGLDQECALSLFNSQVAPVFNIPIATALSFALSGQVLGEAVVDAIIQQIGGTLPPGFALQDLNYNIQAGEVDLLNGLNGGLTVQQQALLGCGMYYGTNCHAHGIDLFNAEASVLLQAFPQFETGGPVATRVVNGQIFTLPGARGPDDPLYDPRIDGCVDATHNGLAPAGFCADSLQNLLSRGFRNELGVISQNLLAVLAVLGDATPTDPNCNLSQPLNCALVRAIFGAAGTQRPELRAGGNGRFGRRDFFWHSGAELGLVYNKRNVFGVSTDFAEDTFKTNWGVEFTWINGENYTNHTERDGYSQNQTFNLTLSVDRPTFINFLNSNRTFLFNSQWFVRYIDDYQRNGAFSVNGPVSVLGTFTIFTGYYQDRLLPALTLVHDMMSGSGAVLGQITYRFSESFSASFGAAAFYGDPEKQMVPITQAIIGNNTGDFQTRTKYDGLSALAERDELFFTLRYTF
jgi:hypothetical protein